MIVYDIDIGHNAGEFSRLLEKILSTPSLLACHLPLTSLHEEAGKITEKLQNPPIRVLSPDLRAF